jgi:Alanine racemase, N-terminal domain
MSTLTISARTTPAAAVLTVDFQAVAASTRLFERRTDVAIMAVLRGDGFGHAAVETARTALDNGAAWLGVTNIDETLQLRAAGLRTPRLSLACGTGCRSCSHRSRVWSEAPTADVAPQREPTGSRH